MKARRADSGIFNEAVIFDMDGVISDTQGYHALAESTVLAEHGITTAPAVITARYAGVEDRVQFAEAIGEHGLDATPEQMVGRKWELMGDLAKDVAETPGATALIKQLHRDGFALAVASASRQDFIDFVLERLAVTTYFQATTSSHDVSNGKPAPDIFLRSAEKLGKVAAVCVVIEDGVSGMLGARAAGMACLGLRPDLSRDYPADRVVRSLEDVSVADLRRFGKA